MQARLLPADADLNKDEVSVRDRRVEIRGHLEAPLEALPRKHPPRHAPDDVPPLGIDVLKNEIVHRKPGQPGDQLRRVGGSASDHRDLHCR